MIWMPDLSQILRQIKQGDTEKYLRVGISAGTSLRRSPSDGADFHRLRKSQDAIEAGARNRLELDELAQEQIAMPARTNSGLPRSRSCRSRLLKRPKA
jgi:hypothetical protein